MLPPDGKPLPGEPETTSGEAIGGLLSAGLAVGFIWLCVATFNALFVNVFGRPVYVILLVVVGLGAFGVAFYVLRDLRKSKIVAAIQVVIAIAAGTVAILGAATLPLQALAALAAGVVVANGASKLFG